MKKLLLIAVAAAFASTIWSCKKQTNVDAVRVAPEIRADENMTVDLTGVDFRAMFANHQIAQRGTTSSSDVYTNNFESLIVDGESVVHRNHKKYTLNFSASDAPNQDVEGHACTLWTLVWHSADDAFGGQFPYAMYRVGGNVSGDNSVNISGTIKEGQTSDYYNTNASYIDPETGEEVIVFDGSSPLVDAETAFLVPIIKSHGMMDPELMPGQIHTFSVGCDGDPDHGGPAAPCHEYVYALHF